MPADLERLHKYMLEIEGIDHISAEMRAVVESEWPELVHKLPAEGATGLTMRPEPSIAPTRQGLRNGGSGLALALH